MILAPVYKEEKARMQDLRALNILDTPPDIRYDLITEFAANLFQAPICTISFIDSDRVWFKSVVGVDINEIPRDTSICGHSICQSKARLPEKRICEIPNAKTDERFFDKPLVTKAPYVHSYLSYVLQSDSGENIGTFCIMDTKERTYTESDYEKLMLFGDIIENILHGRHFMSGIIAEIH